MPDEHKDNIVELPQQEAPEVEGTMIIEMLSDGDVHVLGVPPNIRIAIGVLHAAIAKVILYYINKAQQGKLDALGTVIEVDG